MSSPAPLQAHEWACDFVITALLAIRLDRVARVKPLRQSKRPAERRRLVRDEQTPNKRDGVTRRDKSESKGSDRRSHKEETERATQKGGLRGGMLCSSARPVQCSQRSSWYKKAGRW